MKTRVSVFALISFIFFLLDCIYTVFIEKKIGVPSTELIHGRFAFAVIASMYVFVLLRLFLSLWLLEVDRDFARKFFAICPPIIQRIEIFLRFLAVLIIFAAPSFLRSDNFSQVVGKHLMLSLFFPDFASALNGLFIVLILWDLIVCIAFRFWVRDGLNEPGSDAVKKRFKKTIRTWLILDGGSVIAGFIYSSVLLPLYTPDDLHDWLAGSVIVTIGYFVALLYDAFKNKYGKLIRSMTLSEP